MRLARTVSRQGREVTIFAITGLADADFSEFDVVEVALGTIGETRQQIKAADCTEVAMVGKVRRPSLAQLRPDAHAVKLLARAVGKGDDALLRVIASFFEEDGISMGAGGPVDAGPCDARRHIVRCNRRNGAGRYRLWSSGAGTAW